MLKTIINSMQPLNIDDQIKLAKSKKRDLGDVATLITSEVCASKNGYKYFTICELGHNVFVCISESFQPAEEQQWFLIAADYAAAAKESARELVKAIAKAN